MRTIVYYLRMGRKSTYAQEIADEICERVAEGETLRAICRDEHMPSWRTVYAWLEVNKDFAARFAQSRKLGFDAIAEEAFEIANNPVIGEEIEEDGARVKVKRADMLGHRKLQIWTRLQLLARWCPEKYGDRTAMELTGKDGGPVVQEVVRRIVDPKNEPDGGGSL